MTRVARARSDAGTQVLRRRLGVVQRDRHLLPASASTIRRAGERKRHRFALSAVAVMSVTGAIISTSALPAYAVHPAAIHAGGLRPGAAPTADVQSFVVAASAGATDAVRSAFSATSMEQLEAQRAKARALAEAKRNALAAAAAGRTVEHPPARVDPASIALEHVPAAAPSAEPGSIVGVARQYLGVPYIFGGASPSGFDCSGLVKHVYAHFGISLPHSSLRQGADGTRVVEPEPGDLVVIDGGEHIGIYTGGGYMIDAPMPGRVVNERPIYTANHFFVRY